MANVEPVSLSKLSDRFAHLPPRKIREEPEGKRWVRRRENAKFTHNPHITLPTTLDFTHPLQLPSSTFPHPLPSYLPRSILIPPARLPPSFPQTSSAGLFSLSLRGVRRNLRARPSSDLVKAIEAHLAEWLQGGTYLDPDQSTGLLRFPGDPVGGRPDIREIAREAGRLVWAVKPDSTHTESGYHDGGFERYVVHCVARWYGVVSFSKETDGLRLTHLLRPNITRPDPRVNPAARVLDTPPITEASDFHVSDVNPSDFNTSDTSDIDSVPGDLLAPIRSLSDIEESHPSSPVSLLAVDRSNFAIDSDDDADERGFAASMESLSLSAHADLAAPSADTTRTQGNNLMPSRARANRDRLRTLYPRSTSSPSPARRSPHRLPRARKLAAGRKRKAKNDKTGFAGAMVADKGTFYDYLFA